MHNEYKRQSPYRGFWIIMLLLILPPIICWGLVDSLLAEYSRWLDALDAATAQALGCGLGFLFHMICIFCGVLTDGWQALKYRIGEFCENLTVGVGYAFSSYWEDMRTDGVTFIIYGSVILINTFLTLDGVMDCIAIVIK